MSDSGEMRPECIRLDSVPNDFVALTFGGVQTLIDLRLPGMPMEQLHMERVARLWVVDLHWTAIGLSSDPEVHLVGLSTMFAQLRTTCRVWPLLSEAADVLIKLMPNAAQVVADAQRTPAEEPELPRDGEGPHTNELTVH